MLFILVRILCRYNYLEKMRGITTLYQMPSGTGAAAGNKNVVRLSFPIAVPGVESIVIPSGTRGLILRSVDENLVLVHWEVILYMLFRLDFRKVQLFYLHSIAAIRWQLNEFVNRLIA